MTYWSRHWVADRRWHRSEVESVRDRCQTQQTTNRESQSKVEIPHLLGVSSQKRRVATPAISCCCVFSSTVSSVVREQCPQACFWYRAQQCRDKLRATHECETWKKLSCSCCSRANLLLVCLATHLSTMRTVQAHKTMLLTVC